MIGGTTTIDACTEFITIVMATLVTDGLGGEEYDSPSSRATALRPIRFSGLPWSPSRLSS
jgi:hypothetical protein